MIEEIEMLGNCYFEVLYVDLLRSVGNGDDERYLNIWKRTRMFEMNIRKSCCGCEVRTSESLLDTSWF